MAETTKKERGGRTIQRVLRHKYSQEYFTGNGWTKDLEAARKFQDCLEAAQTCAQFRLFGIEMVLWVAGANTELYCTEFR